jgi:hypothetical protein
VASIDFAQYLLTAFVAVCLFSAYSFISFIVNGERVSFSRLAESFSQVLGFLSLPAFLWLRYHLSFHSYMTFLPFWLAVGAGVLVLCLRKRQRKCTSSPFAGYVFSSEPQGRSSSKQAIQNIGPADYGLFVLCILLSVSVAILDTKNADDAVYVSAALRMIDSPHVNLLEPSFGDESILAHPAWQYDTWPLLVAVLSAITGTHVGIIFHSILPPILMLLVFSANLRLGEILFPKNQLSYAVATVIIFYCLNLRHDWPQGCFLISRLWQGKAVFLHVVLPTLTYAVLAYLHQRRLSDYLLVYTSLLSSAGLSSTAIPVGLVSAVLISAAWLLLTRTKQSLQSVLFLCPALVIPVLLLYDIASQLRIYLAVPEVAHVIRTFSWWNVASAFFDTDYMSYAAPALPLVIAATRPTSKVVWAFLVLYPLLLMVFVLNPIPAEPIMKYFGMSGNFFRLFWLYPTAFLVAFVAVNMATYLGGLLSFRLALPVIQLLILSVIIASSVSSKGWPINCWGMEKSLRLADNVHKIPSEAYRLVKFICRQERLHSGKVLAPEEIAWFVPTYCTGVRLVGAREGYIYYFFGLQGKHEEKILRLRLFQELRHPSLSGSELGALLDRANVTTIIAPRFNHELSFSLKDLGYSNVLSTDNYNVFCRARLRLEK